jgi:hypothetical protein
MIVAALMLLGSAGGVLKAQERYRSDPRLEVRERPTFQVFVVLYTDEEFGMRAVCDRRLRHMLYQQRTDDGASRLHGAAVGGAMPWWPDGGSTLEWLAFIVGCIAFPFILRAGLSDRWRQRQRPSSSQDQ